MLDADLVRHVARLARLELTDEELDRHAGELSNVVDWVDKITELGDLEDVEPTARVVALTNVLREDEPRPSLPVEAALASAPDASATGFRVPSPTAGSGSEGESLQR